MVPEHLTDVPLIAPLLFLSTVVLNVPVTRNAFIDFDDPPLTAVRFLPELT